MEQPPDLPGTELREITDARTLRALAHPVRIALIELLSMEGAKTATEASERIGESPTTCSFHLRQLARYGMVQEAGGGKGRERPWRMTTIGQTVRVPPGDVAGRMAADALEGMIRERQLARWRAWLAARGSWSQRWQDAADDSEFAFYVTLEEFERLTAEVRELMMSRYRDRLADPSRRPPGAVPVEVLLFAYPMAGPPDPGSSDPAQER